MIDNHSRASVEISGSLIIPEPLPFVQHSALRCFGQRINCGESVEPAFITLQNCCDPGLLEHKLRHQDSIRISRLPPRQLSSITLEPRDQRTTKLRVWEVSRSIFWRSHDDPNVASPGPKSIRTGIIPCEITKFRPL